MCFSMKTPDVPEPPPVPSKDAEDAKARRATEAEISRQQQGRAATIITSPLGDPSFGQNVKRTQLSGF
jgi:hypothetical protein